IEWVAAVGMAVAGLNVGVVWWVLRADRRALRKATELRMYGGFMLLASTAIAIWIHTDSAAAQSAATSVRTAFVTTTSAMSTTGFTSTDWTGLAHGAQVLLLLLLSIGAMAGSAGGGFRYVRLLQGFGFARRELERQLHPTAVRVVRVNGNPVNEPTLGSLNGYIILYFLISGAGAALVALGDSRIGPGSAIALSVSALATAGPQLVEAVPLGEIGSVSKLALALLMLLGRLSIYAAILGVLTVITRVAEYVRRLRRSRVTR
ncbi:MAG: potassium transporter TrkG, partial [Acidimicrobiales bacterium]